MSIQIGASLEALLGEFLCLRFLGQTGPLLGTSG